uniref:Large ribosomal subunit protein mL49 n=1 Tax=Dromaius novaehollandiae TaxID=8790 RepID=A0A8C4IYF3_DRONO
MDTVLFLGAWGQQLGGLPLCRGSYHWPKFPPSVLVTWGWEASGAHGLVERPILPTCIASPLKKDKYPTPSGWGPQQDAPSALPRLVKCSRAHNVPVTGDITSSKRKMACMRKIGGDTWALEEEARELLVKLLGDVRHPQQRLLWHRLKAQSTEMGIKQRELSPPQKKQSEKKS